MSGGKKSSGPAIPAEPAALPGPTLNVPPTPQSVPGHLELLAQQIHQGFPSLGEADLLKNMQSAYRPAAGPDPATAAAIAQSKAGTGMANRGGNNGLARMGRGMINTPGELASLIMQERQRRGSV